MVRIFRSVSFELKRHVGPIEVLRCIDCNRVPLMEKLVQGNNQQANAWNELMINCKDKCRGPIYRTELTKSLTFSIALKEVLY